MRTVLTLNSQARTMVEGFEALEVGRLKDGRLAVRGTHQAPNAETVFPMNKEGKLTMAPTAAEALGLVTGTRHAVARHRGRAGVKVTSWLVFGEEQERGVPLEMPTVTLGTKK